MPILSGNTQHASGKCRAESVPGRTRNALARAAKRIFLLPIIAAGFVGASAQASQADTTLEPMPAELETRFALSALPPALRDKATVYLLDPAKGYTLSRQGTSGVSCLVERTAWAAFVILASSSFRKIACRSAVTRPSARSTPLD